MSRAAALLILALAGCDGEPADTDPATLNRQAAELEKAAHAEAAAAEAKVAAEPPPAPTQAAASAAPTQSRPAGKR